MFLSELFMYILNMPLCLVCCCECLRTYSHHSEVMEGTDKMRINKKVHRTKIPMGWKLVVQTIKICVTCSNAVDTG